MIEVTCPLDVAFVNQYQVEEGERVSKGDQVLMLEVMKMQQYMEAPADGIVHFVASLGATVSSGDVLFQIEESQRA